MAHGSWVVVAISDDVLAVLDVKFAVLLPHLDERQRRLYLASEAEALGHGGISAVARLAEVSESTVAGEAMSSRVGRRYWDGCVDPAADAGPPQSVTRVSCLPWRL